jgi:hypothetical protein
LSAAAIKWLRVAPGPAGSTHHAGVHDGHRSCAGQYQGHRQDDEHGYGRMSLERSTSTVVSVGRFGI